MCRNRPLADGRCVTVTKSVSLNGHTPASMTGGRLGYRNSQIKIGGAPVNGTFMALTGSNSAAYNVSVSGSPDELYGKDGLRRLASYWKEQDRLLGEG